MTDLENTPELSAEIDVECPPPIPKSARDVEAHHIERQQKASTGCWIGAGNRQIARRSKWYECGGRGGDREYAPRDAANPHHVHVRREGRSRGNLAEPA